MECDKPDLWSLMNIIPVPKSGDLSNTNNYRGISLMCILAKMFNKLILNRMRSAINPKLRTNQNGFRPERTTVAQILTLRRIIEGVKANNLPAIITFIDFKKTFDSIHRAKMMRILKAYGIPPNLLRAIESMYTNTRARVSTPDGEKKQFNISAEVLQGDTLAPFLYIIVLDHAMRKALSDGKEEELGFTITPRRSRRYPKVVLADLDFANDIALPSDAIMQAQELLLRVETEYSKVGLGLNGPKTKYLAYNIDVHTPLVTRSGTVLEQKDDFKYLLVESILLYGCESWAMTETKVEITQWCLYPYAEESPECALELPHY
ncbi:LINE-1 reverse transcriptase-like [Exaiptasia diaphana]|nr:LINE-1 reverse transcriptase-like [Exaiptasia diaphana]